MVAAARLERDDQARRPLHARAHARAGRFQEALAERGADRAARAALPARARVRLGRAERRRGARVVGPALQPPGRQATAEGVGPGPAGMPDRTAPRGHRRPRDEREDRGRQDEQVARQLRGHRRIRERAVRQAHVGERRAHVAVLRIVEPPHDGRDCDVARRASQSCEDGAGARDRRALPRRGGRPRRRGAFRAGPRAPGASRRDRGAHRRARFRRRSGAARQDHGPARARDLGFRRAPPHRPGRRDHRRRARRRSQREARTGDLSVEGGQTEVRPPHRAVKRAVAVAAIAPFALYLVVALFFAVAQRSFVFPAPAGARTPVGRILEGPGFRGLWSPPRPGAPVVVHFHGNGEDLADLEAIVDLFGAAGAGVLAVEYPGYGLSRADGPAAEATLYTAGAAALVYLRNQGHRGLVLSGQSLGTGVATEMAARGFASRLVLISPYTSMAEVAGWHYPWLPVRLLLRDRFNTA